MQIHCKYDKLIEVSKLKPHPKNRNIHPKGQIDRLAQILDYQGIRAPIVVSKRSGFIVKGHGTLEAIKANKWKEAPVVIQNFKNETVEYAFLQSDNAIASWAELDLKGINEDLGDLGPDFDLDLLGIDGFELDPADKNKGDDAIPAPPKNPKSKPGDLFLLGDHRLLCGSSADANDVYTLFGGERPDCVITSPPYNVGIKYDDHKDKMKEEDFLVLLQTVLTNAVTLGADNLSVFWNMGCVTRCFWYKQPEIAMALGLELKRTLIWKKPGNSGPPVFYQTMKNPVTKNYNPNFCYEFLFYFQKGGKGARELPKSLVEDKSKMNDVWEISHVPQHSKDNEGRGDHPAAFPVQLAKDAIDFLCDEIVFEPFGGSGSTLIAAHKSERKCMIMELSPSYCDVIIDRFHAFSGVEPMRVEEDKSLTPWSKIRPSKR